MSPTKPHRYRCETCNKFHIERLQREEIIEDAIAKVWVNQPMCGDEWLLQDHISMSSECGFCCHSDAVAAEQRIEDVIEELEGMIRDAIKLLPALANTTTIGDFPISQRDTMKTRIDAYKQAINLLRNGVEKK